MTDEQFNELRDLVTAATTRLKTIEARLIFMETLTSYGSARTASYMPGVAGAMKRQDAVKGSD